MDREGHTWAASFRRGVAGEFAADGARTRASRSAPACKRSPRSRRGRRAPASGSGRTGRCSCVTPPSATTALADRARQTAYLVPGLAIAVRAEAGTPRRGRAEKRPAQDEFRFAGGISEFCDHLAQGEPVTDVIRLTGHGNFTETVPVLDDRGHMIPTEVERTWRSTSRSSGRTATTPSPSSFVNVIATPHAARTSRASIAPWSARSTSSSGRPSCSRAATRRSSRKTCWRA